MQNKVKRSTSPWLGRADLIDTPAIPPRSCFRADLYALALNNQASRPLPPGPMG